MARRRRREQFGFAPGEFFGWLREERPGIWRALGKGEMKILWEICLVADWSTGQNAWPSWDRLVAVSGCSRSTVARALDDLGRHGLVTRTGSHKTARGQEAAVYAVSYPQRFQNETTKRFCSEQKAVSFQAESSSETEPNPSHGTRVRDPSDVLRTGTCRRGGSETELLSVVRAVEAGQIRDCRIAEDTWRVRVSNGGELLLTHLPSGAEKRLRRDGDLRGVEFLWEREA